MFKNITIKKSTHEQKSRAFLDFAYAEFSSAIEMLQAAKLTNNKKLSKGFIDHSLDEFKHTLFFLRTLDSFNTKNDNNNKYKFDSKLVYKLGFMNSDYFLFDKYNLSEFSMFVAVNEEQALKLFTKINSSGKQTYKHSYDKSGKTLVTAIHLTLKNGDEVVVNCVDWAKKYSFLDQLRISIFTKEYAKFLETAYN